MITPERRARQGTTERRAPRRLWRSESGTAALGRERACEFDVTVKVFASAADMSSTAKPRLLSEIGEVRGSLKRITAAEFLAREAAVQGNVGAEPSSSSPSSQGASSRGTSKQILVREAAVHGSAGAGRPSSSLSNAPRHGTDELLLPYADAEPRPRADAAPASKRRKTIPITEHRPAKAFHDVPPERHNAEPDVLARASYLKTRYAGLIAKSADAVGLRRLEDLERRSAAAVEGGVAPEDAEGEMAREALRREEEGSARLAGLREVAREALREVERSARLTVETIHPVHLMELGITGVEHVVSSEGRRDRNGVLHVAPSVHRRRSPLEDLGLFVKPIDGRELETES